MTDLSTQTQSTKTKDSSRPRQTIPIWLTPDEADFLNSVLDAWANRSHGHGLADEIISKIDTSKATQQTR